MAAGLVGGAMLARAQDTFQPLPTQANPYVAHGGNNYGRHGALNDLELTAITRASEEVGVQMAAADSAQEGILAASLAEPANARDIQAKARAVADAELALALARADAFARLKTQMRITDPDKAQALASALTTMGGRGGGGGRGGAPGGRGGAAGARGGAGAPGGN